MENLYESKKFWIIWFSCLESPRSIKEIHRLWDYSEGSKALYQPAGTGHEKSIGEEMIQEGYLTVADEEKKRGATAKKLNSETDWFTTYFKEVAIEEIEEEKQDALENSWDAFDEALKNKAFRGIAFDMEALSEVLPSKMRVSQEEKLLPLVLWVHFLTVKSAYEYIDAQMPMDPDPVIKNGMIGTNELSEELMGSGIPLGKYLEKLIENHGLEGILNSIPESSLDSEMYQEAVEGFEDQMNQISQMFGG
jgi:hypothetical protein